MEYLARVKASGLRREMLRMEGLLDEQVGRMVESRRPFGGRLAAGQDKALDRELARFLVILNRAARGSTLMRNQGVLLLFYFSLHKLFQSGTLLGLLKGLIPRRDNQKGRKVRDRFRQIQTLVEQDPAYRARYLKAVKTFHALVTRQIASVAKALDLQKLVMVDKEQALDDRRQALPQAAGRVPARDAVQRAERDRRLRLPFRGGGVPGRRRAAARVRPRISLSGGEPLQPSPPSTSVSGPGTFEARRDLGRYSKCMVSKKNHFPPQTNPCRSKARTSAVGRHPPLA